MEGHLLSKEFMLKLSQISHKYQIIAQQLINNQQECRRHTALNNNNEFLYAKAMTEAQGRKIKIAMDVEDIIFDYFGIITVQYEISNRQLDRDIQY